MKKAAQLLFVSFLVIVISIFFAQQRTKILFSSFEKEPEKLKIYYTFFPDLQDNLDLTLSSQIDELTSSAWELQKVSSQSNTPDIDIQVSLSLEEKLNYKVMIPVTHFYQTFDSVDLTNDYLYSCFENCSDVRLVLNYLDKDLSLLKEFADQDEFLTYLEEEKSISFIEPRYLDYKYKLLLLNNHYYLDDISKGFLSIGINAIDKSNEANAFILEAKNKLNALFDGYASTSETGITLSQIKTLQMTGVTAMSRQYLMKMRSMGIDFMLGSIKEVLQNASLTHVSNEVSMTSNCTISDTRFCSDLSSLSLLQKAGVDIVELTGNHNNDWGFEANESTINLYNENGLSYFGGGLNAEDAAKTLYKEIGDTKLAFLGYNYYDTLKNTYAIATSNPGANSFDLAKIQSDITKSKSEGAFVIVSVQYTECYAYPDTNIIFKQCYLPVQGQKEDFRKIVDIGADLVIGTQAHQPQTFELYQGKPIFYGLGNLFFDQYMWVGTSHGMILKFYFLKNELLQVKIISTNYDKSMVTYETSGSERKALLDLLFEARNGL
ncbi:CapA family protein [bacterium]|nr:MAG: CapA family protein [bacterium]